MSAFNSLEDIVGSFLFGAGTFTKPTNWAVSLWTASPAEDGTGGTEIADGTNGHVRPLVPVDGTNWSQVSPGLYANALQVSLGTPTGAWGSGPITHFALRENTATGTLRFYGALATPITVSGPGAEKVIAPGALTTAID